MEGKLVQSLKMLSVLEEQDSSVTLNEGLLQVRGGLGVPLGRTEHQERSTERSEG